MKKVFLVLISLSFLITCKKDPLPPTLFEQLINELTNSEYDAGTHYIKMSVSDLDGGTYFYKMSSGGFSKTKQLVVLR